MTVLSKTLAVGVVGALSSTALAQVSDNFDADSSGDYTVLAPADGTVTFAYDYSADGIVPAPNTVGGTTLGLRMTANDTLEVGDAVTAFHNTPLTPFFTLTVDVYMGVTGNEGSTEFGHVGVAGDGATKNTLFLPIDGSGHFLGFTGEGGSSSDFRHSQPSGLTNTGDGTYLNSSNTTNATGDTYQSIFSNANGYPFAGSPGNNWATLEIQKAGSGLTYSFNGVPIIQTTFDGSDGNLASLGYADLFSSVATPFQSQFVVYDNLVITDVPEPATAALLGLGGLAMLRRRSA